MMVTAAYANAEKCNLQSSVRDLALDCWVEQDPPPWSTGCRAAIQARADRDGFLVDGS